MNQDELIEFVSQQTHVDPDTVKQVLKATLSKIKRLVKKKNTVTLNNFGVFTPIAHYAEQSYDITPEVESLYCKLKRIPHDKDKYQSPKQWFHVEFTPVSQWRVFGELDWDDEYYWWYDDEWIDEDDYTKY